jgi:virginiamycin B lyase
VAGAAVVALSGCGGTAPARPTRTAMKPRIAALRLPRGSWPSHILFARGAMWVSESSANAVAELRLDTHRLFQHRLGQATNTSVSDIVAAADGNIWFQGFELVGWIKTDDRVLGYELGSGVRVGLPGAMTAGPDGYIWYTDESVPPRIKRFTPDGTSLRTYSVPAGAAGLHLPAIAIGPGHAVWFIQTSSDRGIPPEALGRLDVDGHYTRIPLSHRKVGATNLVAGPDGAIWITEQSRYAIARVTPSGAVREFPLRPGTVPVDIIRGADGALWFSTEGGIGRVSTAGAIRTWPINGARRLNAIAQAPDRSFWITDPSADRVYHFTLPTQ